MLNLTAFPLEKYIVRAITDVEPPPALLDPRLDPDQEIMLSSEQRRYNINPLTVQTWSSADVLGLDANQFEAFRAALTKRFVIIQGAPGTGKTYVGLRVVEAILQNPRFRTGLKELPEDLDMFWEYKSPLLCICCTNHALDQFLEGIVGIMNKNFLNPKIVRVGGRSKSTILSEFNLREIVRRIHEWTPLEKFKGERRENEATPRSYKESQTNHCGIRVAYRYVHTISGEQNFLKIRSLEANHGAVE
ncbi:helicase required for RNAi-mediated heterochromatin assembly 1-like [Bradysia coprophila]|uniref:helicase required for RNAi-mediated heterochromatin assembly 1-like n=1 Tax=Bradysia coprophila TaxID=38358 RepID=UPI00187D8DBC|nr:helicase required for RNAi-mediated heterochromatin assembly 1-like [Bradysia coprophila]